MLNKFVDKGLLERLHHVATSEFARVSYTDAISILEEAISRREVQLSRHGVLTCRPNMNAI